MAKKASSKVKKGGKAKSIRRKTGGGSKSTEVIYHSTKEIKVERDLIENFIGLQKVMVNLSTKFDNLSGQISRLLYLFEISAKSLAKKELSSSGDIGTKKIMERLENLSQQAGLIGKGLALIHEVGTENGKPVIPLNQQRSKVQIPSSSFSVPMNSGASGMEPSPQKMTREFGEFEKSIASKERKLGEDENVRTNV